MERSKLVNIRRLGHMEIGEAEGGHWRIHPDGSCTAMNKEVPITVSKPDKYDIVLIVEAQVHGAPDHWSLFIGVENAPGTIIQVTGDTWPGMIRQDLHDNVYLSQSLRQTKLLGYIVPGGESEIITIAQSIAPPKAEWVHPNNPNCQDWIFWLVRKLEEANLVKEGSANFVQNKIGTRWESW